MSTISKREHVLLALLCFCMVLAVSTAGAEEQQVFPEKKIAGSRIVRIGYSTGIVPREVSVTSGTTVIWLNDSMAAMEIQFTSKKVTAACQNPIHFSVDESGAFISNRIPMGAVASLCFIEKGLYEYLARRVSASARPAPNEVEFRGTIIVE